MHKGMSLRGDKFFVEVIPLFQEGVIECRIDALGLVWMLFIIVDREVDDIGSCRWWQNPGRDVM